MPFDLAEQNWALFVLSLSAAYLISCSQAG